MMQWIAMMLRPLFMGFACHSCNKKTLPSVVDTTMPPTNQNQRGLWLMATLSKTGQLQTDVEWWNMMSHETITSLKEKKCDLESRISKSKKNNWND